uniref:Uncharacterized protein n=1 Tax=Armadillidium vulgare clopovirus TaxID=2984284 RepID=A0A9C7CEP3_9VIRU|nr:MAG: hypothetical protein [Armadillidium vulgare clopovirus]
MSLIGLCVEMQSKLNEDLMEMREKIDNVKENFNETFKYIIEQMQEKSNNEPSVEKISDQFRLLAEDTKTMYNKIERIEDAIREIKNMNLTRGNNNNETKITSQDLYERKNKKKRKFF